MKIAVISTPYETTPPERYGGTERIASLLTEKFVERGHEVTLFATGDSKTSASLSYTFEHPIAVYDQSIRLLHYVDALEKIALGEYDIIHNHNWRFSMFCKLAKQPMVSTLHNNSNNIFGISQFQNIKNNYLVAISDAQSRSITALGMGICQRIYNGIDVNKIPCEYNAGKYLAFLGNMGKYKGVHHTIEIAKRTGMPLKIAGRIGNNQDFYNEYIAPHIDDKSIEYVGELNDKEKYDFLKNAYATLFPIEWEEPFGLVIIESLACGTPVIAFNRGSVPEIVKNGVNGFVVDTVDEIVKKLGEKISINREDCRKSVELNFSVDLMVNQYEKLFEKIINKEH